MNGEPDIFQRIVDAATVMPRRVLKTDSSTISNEIFDLNLPIVHPGEEPLPSPQPSYDMQMQHARFLLRAQPRDFYAHRLVAMNSEPFCFL